MLYIVRYGEIGIKGKNRIFFEKALVNNIRQFCNPCKVERFRGRILVETNNPNFERIFGIVNYSPAERVEKNFQKIREEVFRHYKNQKSFRISARRLDKNFEYNSQQMEIELGKFVEEKTGMKVKLEDPELNIGVEILKDFALVFSERIKGKGGLPVGTSGVVTCEINNCNDELACLLAMKRGCFPKIKGNSLLLNKYVLNQPNEVSKAKISGKLFEEIIMKEEDTLYPLVAYDDKKIKEELEFYKL